MRIAINTRFLLPTKMEGFGWYTYEVSKRLVEMHPEHQFFFFFDRPYDPSFVFAENVTPILLRPPARHPILFYIWFEWSVRRALKRYKIDTFFSPDGYLSLRTNVRQVGVIHDINFEHFPQDIPPFARAYLRHFFPKFARKADTIITVSDYSKNDIIRTYSVDASKVHAIWNGVSEAFRPLGDHECKAIRERLTQGKEYFLFVGALHPRKNLNRLLEAFALFKAETKAETELVIVGSELWTHPAFATTVPDTLKDSIHFTGHLSLHELTEVMAAAKIFTFVPYFEGFGIPLVEAMRCGTPILAGNLTSLPEVAGDAAVYCDPFDVSDIAQQLIALNASSELRAALRLKGIERSQLFGWDQCAAAVSKILFD